MSKTIPVFYRKEQNAPRQGGSPSAQKPEEVVSRWLARGYPIELTTFQPASVADLSLAHNKSYVEGVLSGRVSNGFGTHSPEVAKALPYTTGSFVAAAMHVYKNGGVAVSPTSGFHHASYNAGGGFCTFNGLMVAAVKLLNAGARRVAVLDLDAHYGNGTDDIIVKLGLEDKVFNYTHGSPGYQGYDNDADGLYDAIQENIHLWKKAGVAAVLYQAGADPHIDDPLGGYYTSTEMQVRDRLVFRNCEELGLPVAWNLAGGYQEGSGATFAERIKPVIDIHDRTMQECVNVFAK